MRKKRKNKIVVAVSGGFDPVHVGHVRLFQEAKKLGDELVVILNNDHWLRSKKGFVFMPERERKELLEAIGCVNKKIGTKMIFGVGRGGKVQSSSRLLKKFHENSGSNPKS